MWPGDHQDQMCASAEREDIEDVNNHQFNYLHTHNDEDFTVAVLKIRVPCDRSYQDHGHNHNDYSETRSGHRRLSICKRQTPDDLRPGINFHRHRGMCCWSNNSVNTVLICFVLFLLNGCVTASKDFNFPDIKQGKYNSIISVLVAVGDSLYGANL